jgi:hypothetical protein
VFSKLYLKSGEIFMRDLSIIQEHCKKSSASRKLSRCDLMEVIAGVNGLESKTEDIRTKWRRANGHISGLPLIPVVGSGV